MITMGLEHAVRRHVAMDDEFSMSMVFTLVNVLGRSHREQADGHADGQAEYARSDARDPHTWMVRDIGLLRQIHGRFMQ